MRKKGARGENEKSGGGEGSGVRQKSVVVSGGERGVLQKGRTRGRREGSNVGSTGRGECGVDGRVKHGVDGEMGGSELGQQMIRGEWGCKRERERGAKRQRKRGEVIWWDVYGPGGRKKTGSVGVATNCHDVMDNGRKKKEKKKVMSFYLRVGGACSLYTHCQALLLSHPSVSCRVCSSALAAGKVPFRCSVFGKVLFRPDALRQPAAASKHALCVTIPYPCTRLRVTISLLAAMVVLRIRRGGWDARLRFLPLLVSGRP